MKPFAIGAFTVACVALLLAGAGRAAPVPKDAGKVEPTPDLKAFFDAIGTAVKAEKWPAEADEKKLRDTARVVFERALKAAEHKERKLPVDFEKLTKADVAAEYKQVQLNGGFVIAGDVQITSAKDSVIFASGDVQLTTASNCVIVARNVRCTSANNCTVVAGEYIRATGTDQRKGGEVSVLVAGQWIRVTVMNGSVCHVLRPGVLPAPDEAKLLLNGPHPAIRVTVATNVTYLNAQDETTATRATDCTNLLPKAPIAK
jgi:hypothetical protein